ncbi:MAG: putative glycosyltransferase (group 1) [Bacteroidetes bacterium]|nr:putative glycosyltransferase (group 1) [Bacteroidota bacterium]
METYLTVQSMVYDGFLVEGWQMTDADRCCLISILSRIKPDCAIEVGTSSGGSLQVIARYSRQVYSIDIDTTYREQLAHKYPNVEFLIGNSAALLPTLLKRLDNQGQAVDFILIDGNHQYNAVRADVNAVLQYRPRRQLYILMHDTFNPPCRQGILDARWQDNPCVHDVDLDFVHGTISDHPEFKRHMWDGLGLAIMMPTERTHQLTIHRSQELLFRKVRLHSAHLHPVWVLWRKLKVARSLLNKRIHERQRSTG